MNAFDQLSAMRGPNVIIILINSQWGTSPSEWTITYENDTPDTKIKLSMSHATPEGAILAMYERLTAVSAGLPGIAPKGIEYKPFDSADPEAYFTPTDPDKQDYMSGAGDDEILF